jgi:hypothetical protein
MRHKKGGSKLTPAYVQAIKYALNHGIKGNMLAKVYNVSEANISLIRNGKRWQEV